MLLECPQRCFGCPQCCPGVPSMFWVSSVLSRCPHSHPGVPIPAQVSPLPPGVPISLRCPHPAQVSPSCPGVPIPPRCHHSRPGVPSMFFGVPSMFFGVPILLRCPHPALRAPLSPQAAMPVEPLVCARTATRLSPVPDVPGAVALSPHRVSSVLNRDVKHFGKQHLFDGSEETCWNSDQGTSQWVTLEFPSPVRVSQLQLQFQGGFSSRLCTLEDSSWRRRCWTS
ncbi:nuclear receptor 2C2-associated protein isoform X4 [Prinia subflava]|uniref:nuclear receptor 2C2-associated protein isoform X4 n=1 Tax=Prinia subflava TaxID=208062 RepID=UPI002FE04F9C